MSMLITFIAVMDDNRLIGGRGGIPWKLPRDAQFFRDTTNGHHLLLGRRTYEEMIGWFDRHIPLVITRNEDYALHADDQGRAPGVVVHSVEAAIERARKAGETELFIAGGGEVFADCLGVADRLLLTRVRHAFPAPPEPVYFPEFPAAEWSLTHAHHHPADADNAFALRFEDWRRAR